MSVSKSAYLCLKNKCASVDHIVNIRMCQGAKGRGTPDVGKVGSKLMCTASNTVL